MLQHQADAPLLGLPGQLLKIFHGAVAGVDGVGHVVQAGHNDRSINQAEHRGEQPFYLRGQAHVDHGGDGVTDLPADGAHDGLGDDHSRNQRAEGNHDHTHHFRAVPIFLVMD